MEYKLHCKRGGGGLVGIHNNLLYKEWVDMSRAAHTPSAVTNNLKINGFVAAMEAPTTGGRVFQRRFTRGDPYKE